MWKWRSLLLNKILSMPEILWAGALCPYILNWIFPTTMEKAYIIAYACDPHSSCINESPDSSSNTDEEHARQTPIFSAMRCHVIYQYVTSHDIPPNFHNDVTRQSKSEVLTPPFFKTHITEITPLQRRRRTR